MQLTLNKKKIFKLPVIFISVFYIISIKRDFVREEAVTRYEIFFTAALLTAVLILFLIDSYQIYRTSMKPGTRDIKLSQFLWCGWVFVALLAFVTFYPAELFLSFFYLLSAVSFALFPTLIAAFYLILGILAQYLYLCVLPWIHNWTVFTTYTVLSCLFATLGYQLKKERSDKQFAESQLSDMKDGAKAFFSALPEDEKVLINDEKRIENLHSTFSDFQDRVFKILQQVKELIDPYTVAFFKIKEDGGYYRIFEAFSENDYLRYNEDLLLEEGVVGWIHKHNKPLNLGSVKGGNRTLNYYDKDVLVKSFLGIPVYSPAVREKILGVLVVDSLQEDAFSDETEQIVKLSANQVQEALDNSQLMQQMSQQNKEFHALYSASKKLLQYVSLDDNLNGFIDLIGTLLKFEIAAVCILENETLRVKVCRGLSESVIDTEVDRNSLMYWVIKHNQDLDLKRYNEKKRESPLIAAKVKIPASLSRVLIHPFMLEGRPIGSLVLGFSENEPSEYEKSVLDILRNQACVAISNALLYEQVNLMATTDGLTGVYNHRYFQERFSEMLDRAKRYDETFSMILMDIDFFKKVNDTYGHPVGDIVLKKVSAMLKASARKVDVVARYGGEEFAILMPQSNKDGSFKFAERMRKEIEATSVSYEGGMLSVTVSMGVSGFPEDGREKSVIIEKADQALYAAKKQGRNRVLAAGTY